MAMPVIIVDSREKYPWLFKGYRTVKKALEVGDYTFRGYAKYIAVERKSMTDFLSRSSYKQFKKFLAGQVADLQGIRYRIIIVEGHPGQTKRYSQIVRVKPEFVINAATAIMAVGVPVLFAGNRILAEYACLRFLTESKRKLDLE